MRRADKAMESPAALEALLGAEPVGRLATVGSDGYPVIKPVNYVYADGAVYFHSARLGEKIDHLGRDDRVCFEVDRPVAYVRTGETACKATYLYQSVILKGRARFVEDPAEKVRVLRLLVEKHQGPGKYRFEPGHLGATAVVRIDVEAATGKEGLGKGRVREQALKALAEGRSLPVVIEEEE